MGRAPCCDKANVKKGPWSPEEDAKLKAYIDQNGTGGNWIALPQKIGLRRCGKSCRLRWLNYLRPNLKHGGFSEEEDNIICSLYISIGSRWSIIAAQLPGRTDNDIKNYWNTRLKKKLLGKQRKEQQAKRANSCCLKQEMRRESENFMVPHEAVSQIPYWPVLAVAQNRSQDDLRFKEQESIDKFHIKMESRCSDNDSTNFQYPQDQLYHENSINMLASSTSTNSINSSNCSQLPNTHYDHLNGAAGPNMFEGLVVDNFPKPADLDELLYGSNPQGLNVLESFYGLIDHHMVNGSTGTSSVESNTTWGDVYNPILSDFEACQQGMLQNSAFEESRCFGSQ